MGRCTQSMLSRPLGHGRGPGTWQAQLEEGAKGQTSPDRLNSHESSVGQLLQSWLEETRP